MGAGERAFDVAEQFAFDQLARQCAAGDVQKRLPAAARLRESVATGYVLPDAGLADQQDRDVVCRGDRQVVEHPLQRRRPRLEPVAVRRVAHTSSDEAASVGSLAVSHNVCDSCRRRRSRADAPAPRTSRGAPAAPDSSRRSAARSRSPADSSSRLVDAVARRRGHRRSNCRASTIKQLRLERRQLQSAAAGVARLPGTCVVPELIGQRADQRRVGAHQQHDPRRHAEVSGAIAGASARQPAWLSLTNAMPNIDTTLGVVRVSRRCGRRLRSSIRSRPESQCRGDVAIRHHAVPLLPRCIRASTTRFPSPRSPGHAAGRAGSCRSPQSASPVFGSLDSQHPTARTPNSPDTKRCVRTAIDLAPPDRLTIEPIDLR